MRFEAVPVCADRRAEPAELPEWMDAPCSFEEFKACLRDLEQVNLLSMGYRPTFAFLDAIAAGHYQGKALHILDVGFGSGTMLGRVAQWARKRNLTVKLTGIDLNPLAARVAEERCASVPAEWLTGDALAYSGTVDVIISSLLTHHLGTADVVRFLAWMESAADVGWFINDLQRSARSARLFGMLSRAMRWHRFVQHDGPVSFARSFVAEDWHGMLALAGVTDGAARLVPSFPSRLCVSRVK